MTPEEFNKLVGASQPERQETVKKGDDAGPLTGKEQALGTNAEQILEAQDSGATMSNSREVQDLINRVLNEAK